MPDAAPDYRPIRTLAAAALVAGAIAAPSARAADGVADPSFAGIGVAPYPWNQGGQNNDVGRVLVADNQGNLYLVGSFDSVAGDDDWGVLKTDRAGNVCLSQYLVFDLGGTNTDLATGVALDGSGGLVISGQALGANGSAEVRICRLHASDLTLDTAFAGGSGCAAYTYGGLPLYAVALARAADGGWLVGGGLSWGAGDSDAFVVKLTNNGALDTTFNALDPFHPGLAIVPIDLVSGGADTLRAIAVDHQGRILMTGDAEGTTVSNAAWVARLTGSGILDSGFGTGGVQSWTFFDGLVDHPTWATSVAVDPALDSFVVGYSHHTATANEVAAKVGHFDASGIWQVFPSSGLAVHDVTWRPGGGNWIESVLYQCDGKVLAVGDSAFGDTLHATRLRTDGTLDPSYGSSGVTSFALSASGFGAGHGVASAGLSAGRLVLVGSSSWTSGWDWVGGRFTDRLVACDAFESGTRSGWSASSP